MSSIEEITRGLNEFKEFLSKDADNILFKNIEGLKGVIVQRIKEGKDANGSGFGSYSDAKINPSVFDDITRPADARNFINKAIKNRESISYKEIREASDMPTDSKNFFFTGDMLNSIAQELTEESDGRYEITIQPSKREEIDKLIANENRDGEILVASEQEVENLTNDIEEDFLKIFIKLIQ